MFQIALIALLLQAPASIEGIVIKQGVGEPLSGATVQLNLAGETERGDAKIPPQDFHRTATSDRNGRFVFESVLPGEYQLIATHPGGGYVPVEFGQRSVTGQGIHFQLAASQKMTGIVLAMTPTGSISGRVYDADGEPLGKAQVQAMRPIYKNGQRTFTIAQIVQTDDRGEYRLFWLTPGRYYVGAKPDIAEIPLTVPGADRMPATRVTAPARFGTYEQASSPVVTKRRLRTGEVVEETHVPVYFPGATEIQSATPIAVAAGAAVGGIDFSTGAGRVVTHHIRGRVIHGATGQPIERAFVQVVPRTRYAPPVTIIPSGQSSGDGLFDIAGVAPGSYLLVASNNPLSAIVPIDVGDKDLENIPFVLSPAVGLAGRFIIDGPNRTVDGVELSLLRLVLTSEPAILGMTSPGIGYSPPPASDGSFKLMDVTPGNFRVGIRALPPDAYVKSIRMGNDDVLNDGLHISGPPENPIEIVIGTNAGSIDGTVVNARQQALPNRTVVLVPDIRLRLRSDLYKTVATDDAGRFQFRGITPGSYKLFAWEEVESGAWQDPDFIRPFEGSGKPVQVNDGRHENLQLAVIP